MPTDESRPGGGELDPESLAEVRPDISVLDGNSGKEKVALDEGLGKSEDGELEDGGCQDETLEEVEPDSNELEIVGPDVSKLDDAGEPEDVEFHDPVPLGAGKPEDGRPEDRRGSEGGRSEDDGPIDTGAVPEAPDKLGPADSALEGEGLAEDVVFPTPGLLGEGQFGDGRLDDSDPEDEGCKDGKPVWLELKSVPDNDDDGKG